MRNYHQDYFYIVARGDNTPRLSFNRNQIKDTHMLFAERPLDENYVVSLKFGYPIPRNPELGDLLKKAQHPILSDRLKELLQSMKLKDIQFLPTEIVNPKDSDQFYTNYWVLHIHNLINCMNQEKSEYETSNGFVASIQKLVLDHEALDKIPLEERLVFALGEQRLNMFFHRYIVERIIALEPKNVMFNCLATQEELEEPFDEAFSKYINMRVIREEKKTFEPGLTIKEKLRRKALMQGRNLDDSKKTDE